MIRVLQWIMPVVVGFLVVFVPMMLATWYRRAEANRRFNQRLDDVIARNNDAIVRLEASMEARRQ